MRRSLLFLMVVLIAVFIVTSCGKKEEATDANIKKIESGMTLSEVEAIIGKGTRYSDLDLKKVKLGFSIKDPAAQRNTYVWIRTGDNSAYVAIFEGGKLASSMTYYQKE